MALATLAFIVGALLTLPGFGIGLCSVMLPVFPEWLVRISVTIAIFGTLLVAWALWRMMR
jgi:hypothetical protein